MGKKVEKVNPKKAIEKKAKPTTPPTGTRSTVKGKRLPPELLVKSLLNAIEFRPSLFGLSINFKSMTEGLKGKGAEYRKSLEEKKIEVVKQLLESDIDPKMFDVLLENEIDRRLKVRFGATFLLLTLLFTSASYAIVILDGIHNWNISDVAITALIIETPMQFIGLLYIIARNLFPQTGGIREALKPEE